MKRRAWSVTAVLLLGAAGAGAAALDDLWQAKPFAMRRASSYDVTGGNGDGGQGAPIKPGEIRELAVLAGPAVVRHIWITIGSKDPDHLKNLWLRVYWDGEPEPSIDSPVGDFFCQGHGTFTPFASAPVAIGNQRGLNCFWPMPFNERARFTVENRGPADCGAFYFYFDYELHQKRFRDLRTFHAQYREERPVLRPDNYTFLYAEGAGQYVGVFHTVKQTEDGWWGEGDDMIFVDGEDFPSLHGTGSEDYFCHAWGMGREQPAPYFGALMNEGYKKDGRHSQYRFHLEDPVPFTRSIHVSIEHGHANDRADEFTSVAYWYQTEPHRSFSLGVPTARPRAAWSSLMDLFRRIEEEPGTDVLAEGKVLAARYADDFIQEWWDSALWEQGERKGRSPRGMLVAARVATAPTIDGVHNDPAWSGAEWQKRTVTDGGAKPALDTWLAAAYDDANLYLCLVSQEDPARAPRAAVAPGDVVEASNEAIVFDDDCAEWFIGCSLGTTEYHQLIVNRNLARFDGFGEFKFPDHKGERWDPELQVAATQAPDQWVVELALPFEAFGEGAPTPDTVWRAALRRVRRWDGQSSMERWPATDWTRGTPHVAPLFGHLLFR